MHPECALVFQHLKAQEECTQILRLEQSNRSNTTGQSTTCRREWRPGGRGLRLVR